MAKHGDARLTDLRQTPVSEMSYHQGDRIKLRAHWLAIEFVFYLLGLLTLGAQLASLLTCSRPALAFLG